MKEIITKEYISNDGKYFLDKELCQKHEESYVKFVKQIEAKIGSFDLKELSIGEGLTTLTKLPSEAPWLSPYGACLIMITDIRRDKEGIVEFQLGDESAEPYEEGNVWCKADRFYTEWPD